MLACRTGNCPAGLSVHRVMSKGDNDKRYTKSDSPGHFRWHGSMNKAQVDYRMIVRTLKRLSK